MGILLAVEEKRTQRGSLGSCRVAAGRGMQVKEQWQGNDLTSHRGGHSVKELKQEVEAKEKVRAQHRRRGNILPLFGTLMKSLLRKLLLLQLLL